MQNRPGRKCPWNGAFGFIAVLGLVAAMAGAAAGAEPKAALADPRLDKKITYSTAQASVQDVAQSLAGQVGLKYEWKKSFEQTDPICRGWVRNLSIKDKSCRAALEQVLAPVGLRYQVENDALVLYKRQASEPAIDARLEKPVKYANARASVQDIVMELSQQAGLRYDFQKSLNQTRPRCQSWVTNVTIDAKSCRAALEEILQPVGLHYQIENDTVVLYPGRK